MISERSLVRYLASAELSGKLSVFYQMDTRDNPNRRLKGLSQGQRVDLAITDPRGRTVKRSVRLKDCLISRRGTLNLQVTVRR